MNSFTFSLFFKIVGMTTIHACSSSIPFEKSILGIDFGFTILLKIYCMICVTISDDGMNKIRKLNRYIPIFFVYRFKTLLNASDNMIDKMIFVAIYSFCFVFSAICFGTLHCNS